MEGPPEVRADPYTTCRPTRLRRPPVTLTYDSLGKPTKKRVLVQKAVWSNSFSDWMAQALYDISVSEIQLGQLILKPAEREAMLRAATICR